MVSPRCLGEHGCWCSMRRLLLLVAFMVSSLGSSVMGVTLEVPSKAHPTNQDAIDAAVEGDIVSIAAGTYFEHDLQVGDKGITIRGETDAAGEPAVIIDAQQQGGSWTSPGIPAFRR